MADEKQCTPSDVLDELFFTSEFDTHSTDAPSLSDSEFQDSLDALFRSIEPESPVDVTCESASVPATSVPVPLPPSPLPSPPLPSPPLPSLISAIDATPPSFDIPAGECRPLSSPASPTDNLFYHGIRHLLQTECKHNALPSVLLRAMHPQQQLSVTVRESALLNRFRRLERSYHIQIRELSTLYRYHASSIEMERMEILADSRQSSHYLEWLGEYFDGQIHQVMDRVERSLDLLEEKDSVSKSSHFVPGVRRRPPLSRQAIELMENWYDANLHHPYPSATVCEALATSGNIAVEQVKKWFGNKRNRKCNTKSRSEIAKRKFLIRHGMAGCSFPRNFAC